MTALDNCDRLSAFVMITWISNATNHFLLYGRFRNGFISQESRMLHQSTVTS